MQNKGLAHLCHHDRHWEWCSDYAERVKYIQLSKPLSEQPERLKWFAVISDDRLPKALREAEAAFNKARAALNKAREDYDKARAAYNKAGEDYYKAEAAFNKAEANSAADLDLLHAEMFPGCPWDGKTMFPAIKG